MKWIAQDPRPHQTALAMIGAKPGQLVLVLGAGDGRLAAAIAVITGLNGRTLVVDPSEAAEGIVNAAAADAGALVEFTRDEYTTLAIDAGTVDIVLLYRSLGAHADRARVLGEAVRVLRPGGRVIGIEGEASSGWRGLIQRPAPPAISGAAACELLAIAGLRATRVLAELEGVTYVEGAKPR